jgi:hypothetical protein
MLMPGESFSSWFVRTASGNGLLPRELYRAVLPGGRLASLDLDRFAGSELIAGLAESTGRSAASPLSRRR